MNIWGKLLGGAAGFAIGGPIGALLGAVAGHAVDRLSDQAPGDDARTALDERAATRQIAFHRSPLVGLSPFRRLLSFLNSPAWQPIEGWANCNRLLSGRAQAGSILRARGSAICRMGGRAASLAPGVTPY